MVPALPTWQDCYPWMAGPVLLGLFLQETAVG